MFAKLIGNPWFGVGLILVWLSSLVYVAYWRGGEVRAIEESKWQKGYIQAQTLYSARLNELNISYRALENKRAVDAVNLSKNYQKELKAHEAKSSKIIADISAGYLRLRDDAVTCHAASGSGDPETGSDSSRAGGGAQGRLSPEFHRYLVDRFTRADSEVILLNRCIRQLRADRDE